MIIKGRLYNIVMDTDLVVLAVGLDEAAVPAPVQLHHWAAVTQAPALPHKLPVAVLHLVNINDYYYE